MTDRPNAGGRGRSDAMARLAALLADIDPDGSSATPGDPTDPPESPTGPAGSAPTAERVAEDVGDGPDIEPDADATRTASSRRAGSPGTGSPGTGATGTGATGTGPTGTGPSGGRPSGAERPASSSPATRERRHETRSPVRRADSAPRPPAAVTSPLAPRAPDESAGPPRDSPPRSDDDEPIRARGDRRRLTLGSVAFAVAVALLVAGIPVLGYAGSQALLRSRAGRVVEGKNDPDETGYRAIVDPTPTALVIQRDADDVPVAITLLALGAGESGGSVVLIPLTTRVREPNQIVNRLGTAFGFGGTERGVIAVEDMLSIDLAEVVDVDATTLAQLTAPVAPLTIENPDDVMGGDGQIFAAGPLELMADDIGPYLEGSDDEDELARLVRSEAVWRAWLSALQALPAGDQVGAGTTTGIGPYLRTLSAGESEVETLDVALPEGSGPNAETRAPLVPQPGFLDQVLRAVPFPISPSLGRRKTMQVLNGARGEPVPRAILDRLIRANGELTTVGNAASFGRERTEIRYRVANVEDDARYAAGALGVDVDVKRMPAAEAASEDDDLVIVLGKDVVDGQDGG